MLLCECASQVRSPHPAKACIVCVRAEQQQRNREENSKSLGLWQLTCVTFDAATAVLLHAASRVVNGKLSCKYANGEDAIMTPHCF